MFFVSVVVLSSISFTSQDSAAANIVRKINLMLKSYKS